MTQPERITIVTPSYNHAQFVERTVRSVLMQRYPNLEYIVMDGGSKDDTVERLSRYRDRFAHFVSQPDGGQADAIATGFERSTGDIMAYLNSDDLLAPGSLQWVADYFRRNPDVDVVYSHRVTVDENDKVLWYWILPQHSSFLMRRWDLIPQETCFWRRRIWEREGNVDRSFRFAMDYDLFVRFMRRGRFRRANRFLGAFRWHAAAKTSQLLDTIGQEEIRRVWTENGIEKPPFAPFISERFFNRTTWGGLRYAQGGRTLPGSFPGVGYDYKNVWGGLLREPA